MSLQNEFLQFIRCLKPARWSATVTAFIFSLFFPLANSVFGDTNPVSSAHETWEGISARWSKTNPEQLRQAAKSGKADAQYYLAMTEWSAAWEDSWRSRNLWNAMAQTNKVQPAVPAANNTALRTNWAGVPDQEIRQAAMAGDRGARWYISRLESDQGAERAKASIPWLKQSAAQQFLPAVHELAVRYLGQTGWRIVPPDTEEGLKLLRNAVAEGYPNSQLRMAEMLLKGDSLPPDVPAAVKLLQQAAEAGLPRAQYALAQQYAVGNGEPRDAGETPFALFRKAAEAELPDAQLALAERYRTGLGTSQDYFEAARWYCRAASVSVVNWRPAGGAERGGFFLVDVWERAAKPAIGSDPKFDEAFRTYLQGAKLRDAEAQIRIGDHYLHNSGGDHPEARAYFWYDLAATQGASAAVARRDALKGALGAEDLRQVERWTREFNQSP